jgi:hypothetical protein
VRSLHPQHCIGTQAERLLEPDRHLGRRPALPFSRLLMV